MALEPTRAVVERLFGPYLGARNLNLGCALNPVVGPEWTNLDVSPKVSADVVWDLERVPLPFEDHTFDCVLGTHVFEHIVGLVPLMRDIHRILRPGGYLVSVTPYGSSDDAWENPFHVRGFSESTWGYFNRALYSEPRGHAGFGDFGIDFDLHVVSLTLVPYAPYVHDPDLDFKKRHYRNIIRELHAVLRKDRTE